MLEYDDVMNKQREIIYGQRKQVLDGDGHQADHHEHDETACIDSLVHGAFGEHGKSRQTIYHAPTLLELVRALYFPKYAVRYDETQISAPDGGRRLTDRFDASRRGVL